MERKDVCKKDCDKCEEKDCPAKEKVVKETKKRLFYFHKRNRYQYMEGLCGCCNVKLRDCKNRK